MYALSQCMSTLVRSEVIGKTGLTGRRSGDDCATVQGKRDPSVELSNQRIRGHDIAP